MDEIISQLEALIMEAAELADELSDEEMEVIFAIFQEAIAIIQASQAQPQAQPLQVQPTFPELQPGPFPSSNINSFKYDPDNKELYVKFHGKDSADSGPVYKYGGIPALTFEIFRKGAIAPKTSGSNRYHTWIKGVLPSLGASMYRLIKQGGYPYERVA